jgi:hypothetical protein
MCRRLGETIDTWKHVMLRDDVWLEQQITLVAHEGAWQLVQV